MSQKIDWKAISRENDLDLEAVNNIAALLYERGVRDAKGQLVTSARQLVIARDDESIVFSFSLFYFLGSRSRRAKPPFRRVRCFSEIKFRKPYLPD